MGLWMLLLLHLHLGVCVSLPAPSNVSISSFNMEHTLRFLPGLDTPSDAHFAVQTSSLRRRNVWRPVAACSQLTAGQPCNLTRAFKDPFTHYQARVQAFTATQASPWTVSGQFLPLSDTVLGPPEVSVSGCGNCLLLHIGVPTTLGRLKDIHRQLVLRVQRTRDGVEFTMSVPYEEEHVIGYLQPGVEYCVSVSVTSFFNTKPVSSQPHCALTSPPPSRRSLYVVFSLVAAFCALGFLVTGLVIYSGQLSFELLRERLPKTLSYILLQCQTGGSAPVQLSDCSSTEEQL